MITFLSSNLAERPKNREIRLLEPMSSTCPVGLIQDVGTASKSIGGIFLSKKMFLWDTLIESATARSE